MSGWKDTCRKISIMLSDGMDRELTSWERLRIRIHLFICEACSRFARQLRFLREAAQTWVDHGSPQQTAAQRKPE